MLNLRESLLIRPSPTAIHQSETVSSWKDINALMLSSISQNLRPETAIFLTSGSHTILLNFCLWSSTTSVNLQSLLLSKPLPSDYSSLNPHTQPIRPTLIMPRTIPKTFLNSPRTITLFNTGSFKEHQTTSHTTRECVTGLKTSQFSSKAMPSRKLNSK